MALSPERATVKGGESELCRQQAPSSRPHPSPCPGAVLALPKSCGAVSGLGSHSRILVVFPPFETAFCHWEPKGF